MDDIWKEELKAHSLTTPTRISIGTGKERGEMARRALKSFWEEGEVATSFMIPCLCLFP